MTTPGPVRAASAAESGLTPAAFEASIAAEVQRPTGNALQN
jgi:hypothetical protein